MSNLSLVEKYFLLSLDENTGNSLLYNFEKRIKWGIAGGLLISLINEDKIGFKNDVIILQDPTPTKDELLNRVLRLITYSSHNQHIVFWLDQIVMEIKDLIEVIENRLVKKGYLEVLEKTVKFGSKTQYNIINSKFTEKMIPLLKSYLTEERRPSYQYRGLICLLDTSGLYKIIDDWNMEHTRDCFQKYRCYSHRKMKKYHFLSKLNEELLEKSRLHIYH